MPASELGQFGRRRFLHFGSVLAGALEGAGTVCYESNETTLSRLMKCVMGFPGPNRSIIYYCTIVVYKLVAIGNGKISDRLIGSESLETKLEPTDFRMLPHNV